jgi:hypothetical protein
MRLCILASANPTDMAIASSAIAQSNIVRFHFLITASAKAPAALAMLTQSAAPWTAWCAWCTGTATMTCQSAKNVPKRVIG